MSWNVIYVKPRTEKRMSLHCKILDIPHYLPLRQETKIYQRRKVVVHKPVFPGYIFANLTPARLQALQRTNNIVRLMEAENQRQLLHELAQIRKALTIDPTLGTCDTLKRGRVVRIIGGPFMGIEGTIWTNKKNAKIRLNVELIGQAVAVDVDPDFIEVID